MKTVGKLFSLALALAFAQGAAAADNEPTRTVLIGLPTPKGVVHGQVSQDGAQLAVDDANQANIRVGGQKILFKLFIADDKNDENMTLLVARSMLAAGVVGVIGHRTSDTSIVAAKLYSDAGIPQIAPAAAARAFTQNGYRTVFQLIGNSDKTAVYIADALMKSLRAQRVMVIDNETKLGRALADNVVNELFLRKGPPATRLSINSKTSDFSVLIPNIKRHAPDVIFFSGFAPQTMALAKRLAEVGGTEKLLIMGSGNNPEFPGAGPYDDGIWMLGYGTPTRKTRGIQALEKNFRAKFNSPFLPQTLLAYDAVSVLIAAIRQADSLEPPVLVNTLHKIKYKGASGQVSFDAEGNLEVPTYGLYQVRNKRWETVRSYP